MTDTDKRINTKIMLTLWNIKQQQKIAHVGQVQDYFRCYVTGCVPTNVSIDNVATNHDA